MISNYRFDLIVTLSSTYATTTGDHNVLFFPQSKMYNFGKELNTESCFRHPLTSTFLAKRLPRKVEVFDLTIVKKLPTFRAEKAKVEKLKSRKVEKLKS